jgi:hypothetical protein
MLFTQILQMPIKSDHKMKHSLKFLAFIGYLMFMGQLQAQAPFVTTWKTDNPGVSNNLQIQIPGMGTNYDISWEEVGNPLNNGSVIGDNTTIITFPTPGTYKISITPGSGTFTQISFNNSGDKEKILSVDQWVILFGTV